MDKEMVDNDSDLACCGGGPVLQMVSWNLCDS